MINFYDTYIYTIIGEILREREGGEEGERERAKETFSKREVQHACTGNTMLSIETWS